MAIITRAATVCGIALSVLGGCELDPDLGVTEDAITGTGPLRTQGIKIQGIKIQGIKIQGIKIQSGDLAEATVEDFLALDGKVLDNVHVDGTELIGTLHGDGYTEVRHPLHSVYAFDWGGVYPSANTLEDARFIVRIAGLDDSFEPVSELAVARIDDIHIDASTNTSYQPSNDDVYQYAIEIYADGGWVNPCESGYGVFLDGSWSADGTWSDASATFACNDGVAAKCVRDFGYKFWKGSVTSPRWGTGTTVDLNVLYHQCVRAARADYCGDGKSWTTDGTIIDLFDSHGVNTRATRSEFAAEGENGGDYDIEAVYHQGGAYMINNARWVWFTANPHPQSCYYEIDRDDSDVWNLYDLAEAWKIPAVAVKSKPQTLTPPQ